MYTKGEWKKEGNKVKVLGSGTVAICPSPTNDEGVLEFVANANLIASAPDLYEALCNMVRRVDKGLCLGEILDVKPARQALAKAEWKPTA